MDDLMSLSPKMDLSETQDITSDFLTVKGFDGVHDVTYIEHTFDDTYDDIVHEASKTNVAPSKSTTGIAEELDQCQLRMILQKQDQEILQLRQDNGKLRSSVQDLQHKLSRTTEDLEQRFKKWTEKRDIPLGKENKLLHQLNDEMRSNKQMCIVMEEYEKTISSLIAKQQQEKIHHQEMVDKLKTERDEAVNNLASMEHAFSDLLSKYEKCKSVLLQAIDREKTFELKLSEYDTGIKNYELLYNQLKKITSESLENANKTLESMKKSHDVEITTLKTANKNFEIKIQSLRNLLKFKNQRIGKLRNC